ncbi:MAG: YkvA family protein [Bacteroidota bacterium]
MENPYKKYFSEKSLWQKTGEFAQSAGQQVIYAVLLLYYMFNDPEITLKKKVTIAAALGYFIFPADAIPDFTPLIGYTDDLGVLLFALTQIYTSLTPEIRGKARQKMKEWFNKIDEKELLALEEKIQQSPFTSKDSI